MSSKIHELLTGGLMVGVVLIVHILAIAWLRTYWLNLNWHTLATPLNTELIIPTEAIENLDIDSTLRDGTGDNDDSEQTALVHAAPLDTLKKAAKLIKKKNKMKKDAQSVKNARPALPDKTEKTPMDQTLPAHLPPVETHANIQNSQAPTHAPVRHQNAQPEATQQPDAPLTDRTAADQLSHANKTAEANNPKINQPTAQSTTQTPPSVEPAYIWPPSTYISYALTGEYRGQIKGIASLNWVRLGERYEMTLNANLLLREFAIRSQGSITARLLIPERFEEIGRKAPRKIIFDTTHRIARSNELDAPIALPEGAQDAASLFMQIAMSLRSNPHKYIEGKHSLSVVRPHGIAQWDFDVVEIGAINTKAGYLQALHIKRIVKRQEGDFRMDFWLSPQMQYLPVYIRIADEKGQFLEMNLTDAQQELPIL